MTNLDLDTALNALDQGRFEEATSILEKLIEIEGDDPELLVYLGIAYVQSENPQSAVDVLERADELVEEHCIISLFLGRALKALNRLDEAEAQLRRAIRLDAGVSEAWLDLANIYYTRNEFGIACAVLWNIKQQKMKKYCFSQDQIQFPYKSGFLGFRECKLLAKAILELPERPNLVMCDGHGKIHPQRFGEAVQLGVALNIPTIGIAKNPFIGYFDRNKFKKIKGNKKPIWEKNPNLNIESSNELLGFAICLNNDSKPVFISEGYKTTIDSALKISLDTSKNHRQPEPLYLADYLSKEKIRINK